MIIIRSKKTYISFFFLFIMLNRMCVDQDYIMWKKYKRFIMWTERKESLWNEERKEKKTNDKKNI